MEREENRDGGRETMIPLWEEIQNASLSNRFFFLRRNKYEIAKVRYFPGEKLYIKAFSSFFLPLFECPRVPFMIFLQKHLIWMVEVINKLS